MPRRTTTFAETPFRTAGFAGSITALAILILVAGLSPLVGLLLAGAAVFAGVFAFILGPELREILGERGRVAE